MLGIMGSRYKREGGGNDTTISLRKQCKHLNMKTGAARCVYVCACMHYATGALSQAALPGARGESVAKTSNPPPTPCTHLSP